MFAETLITENINVFADVRKHNAGAASNLEITEKAFYYVDEYHDG